MQTLAFPLVIEFGWTKEIEDRLLAPMSTSLVAAEKVVFAALRALIATTLMIPIGILVLGSIPWRWAGFPLFLVILLLGSVLGSAIGLVLGTLVKPNRINIVFALVFTPLLFTGCSQYPWPSLDRLPWFQVVTALNPMTYVSEGMRGALVPSVPAHRSVDLPARAAARDRRVARDRRPRLLPPRDRLNRRAVERRVDAAEVDRDADRMGMRKVTIASSPCGGYRRRGPRGLEPDPSRLRPSRTSWFNISRFRRDAWRIA